jgi:hypothetical protein
MDLQLHVQSVSIITKVVSSNPTHGEVYLIQHYVIKSVSDLWHIAGFIWVLWFPPPIIGILMSVCYTFGFRIIISTAQPDLFKLSHIAVYHKIQIKFDYGEIDIYRS